MKDYAQLEVAAFGKSKNPVSFLARHHEISAIYIVCESYYYCYHCSDC